MNFEIFDCDAYGESDLVSNTQKRFGSKCVHLVRLPVFVLQSNGSEK